MGVWAAGEAFGHLEGEIDRAIAINGTSCPIDDRFGIPTAFYRATEEDYSAGTRDSFYRRMCHTDDRLQRFLAHPPARTIEDQARELTAIRERVFHPGSPGGLALPGEDETKEVGRGSLPAPGAVSPIRTPRTCHYPFDEVLIGAQDRIMRVRNQQQSWEGKAPCRVIDMPHYPFFDITWEEILGDDTNTG